ncbi:hypothetical protein PRK78_007263 [Emydomyces testavorans]|uniref:Endonuclease/exonuclease/phosphatase domain-containing protein n=1 Tax=Emydomyces testavorans TaxID=2070801 RepID=A0AAF0IQF3_9EURO|nr:hypothetical protein PRK78_007263 [Emydomyces testavorans]
MSARFRLPTKMRGWLQSTGSQAGRTGTPPLPALEEKLAPIFQLWHQFDSSSKQWTPLDRALISGSTVPCPPQDANFVLVTWNVEAFSPAPRDRIAAIISHIQNLVPAVDIIFLQEVSRPALLALLSTPWLRDHWYSSEADTTSWGQQAFASMTLLSKSRFGDALGPIWRVRFPSRFERDALCCDLFLSSASADAAPSPADAVSSESPPQQETRIRLVNVHLDSLALQPSFRPRQLSIIAAYLRAAGRGLVAGDFNPVLPEDEMLVSANRLVDAWCELHPDDPGFTWGVDGKAPFPPNRLDKVAMVGLKASEIQVMPPGIMPADAVPEQEQKYGRDMPLRWSDHHGLVCCFSIGGQ